MKHAFQRCYERLLGALKRPAVSCRGYDPEEDVEDPKEPHEAQEGTPADQEANPTTTL